MDKGVVTFRIVWQIVTFERIFMFEIVIKDFPMQIFHVKLAILKVTSQILLM